MKHQSWTAVPAIATLLQYVTFANGGRFFGVESPDDCAKQCNETGYNSAN
jgi:hypothetical protein